MTDKDLIQRTLDNDRAAFAELVDRYRDAVCGVAYHYLGNFDDVQDAAQEAFLQAYSRLPQLREPDKFGPWVRQITTNVCLQTLRRKDNRNLPLEDAPEQSTEDDSRKSAVRLVVREALNKLSDKTRLTVTLCYINGYSHDEVAQFLEVPLNTVRSRLRIAKKQLREEMIEMVHDVLHEDKPGDELTKRVLEIEARQREALEAGRIETALECHDESWELLEQLKAETSPEEFKQRIFDAVETVEAPNIPADVREKEMNRLRRTSPQRLYAEIRSNMLSFRANLLSQVGKHEQSIDCAKKAAQTAGQAGLWTVQAQALGAVVYAYYRMERADLGMPYIRESADLYKRAGKWREAGQALWQLGNLHLNIEDMDKGLDVLAEARETFEKSRFTEGLLACRVVSDLVDELGVEGFRAAVYRVTACSTLKKHGSIISWEHLTGWDAGPIERVNSIFRQEALTYAHLCGYIVNTMPVGESWSHKNKLTAALEFRTTVKSRTATVTLPLGTLENCLHMEITRVDTDVPDSVDESRKQRWQKTFGGVRSIWFAPGVGLVKLHITTGDNREATIELQDYHIVKPTKDYFPLAIGNTWTYTWSGIPGGLCGREVYKMAARKRDEWYLEHYYYVYEE